VLLSFDFKHNEREHIKIINRSRNNSISNYKNLKYKVLMCNANLYFNDITIKSEVVLHGYY
jgi:hypothetical protein